MGSHAKPMEGDELSSFLFGGGRNKLGVVLQHIFGRVFLSPRTTIISGIKNYPSTSMSCCSDDLAQSVPRLDLWSLGAKNKSSSRIAGRCFPLKDSYEKIWGQKLLTPTHTYSHLSAYRENVASFPGSPRARTKATESWAGPRNEARENVCRNIL